jgi:LacI family transcriptional regulator
MYHDEVASGRKYISESMPTHARPRLSDVAAEAGVSLSTASRALSGARGTSVRAAAAVAAASERLGYRPDPVARALRAQSTGLAGIVIPGIANPFFAELVEALESALRSASFEMILADSRGSVEEEALRIETVLDRKVDGLIVIPTDHDASGFALRRAQRSVPVVQIDRQVDGLPGDYVGVDSASGIRAALEHVALQGCRHVVFVSGETTSSTGRSRLDAFRLGVRQFPGLSARTPLLGTFSIEFGRRAVRQIARQKRLPDAVVCGSDLIALGVVRELHEHNVKVPAQVKVTGFDGILFGELCDPPLTTLRQPVETIATEAVRLLDGRVHGNVSPPHRSEIAPVLVVRRSSLGVGQ